MVLIPKDFAKWCTPSRISYMIGFVWLVISFYVQFRLLRVGGAMGLLLLILYSAIALFGVWYQGLSLDCLCKRGYGGLAWFLTSMQIVGSLIIVVSMISMGTAGSAVIAGNALNMSKVLAKETFSAMGHGY